MNATIERYGTALRIYDNGGRTLDRYTILPPRWATAYRYNGPENWGAPWGWACICSSASGHFSGHETATPGRHLGRRIHWQDLPADVQAFARDAFPEWAPMREREVTYHRKPTLSEIRFGYGATHYRDFPIEQCRKPGTTRLKRLILADDGLRYYR